MSDLHEVRHQTHAAAATSVVDAGLRRFMLGVYNKVAGGLLLAAGAAYVTASVPAVRDLLFRTVQADGAHRVTLTFLGAMTAFAPIILLLCSAPALSRPTPLRTGALYWSVVSLVGASMGLLVLTFTGLSIATTLAITALAFGGLSLAGYTTKKDLSAFGGFLTMGVIGLVLTLAANILLRSPAIEFVAGFAGVLIFAGLIAYDTQRLKLMYRQLGGDAGSMAIATDFGALSLFINFVNLFQFLLALVSGERR
jgi:FtsH-binding integral membrane protein